MEGCSQIWCKYELAAGYFCQLHQHKDTVNGGDYLCSQSVQDCVSFAKWLKRLIVNCNTSCQAVAEQDGMPSSPM